MIQPKKIDRKSELIFLTNDKRSFLLEEAVRKHFKTVRRIEYDPISPLYRFLSLFCNVDYNKRCWWIKSQFSQFAQIGRLKRIEKAVTEGNLKIENTLMWGSWFNPWKSKHFKKSKFYCYIDQSCNKSMDENDILSPRIAKAMKRFNRRQYDTYLDCKTIFCMSQWCREQTLLAHDIPEEKVISVGWGPIGVNLADEETNSDETTPMVLFVGHDFFRKGVDFLRAAIPSVAEKFPNVEFVVVGKNPQKYSVDPHPNLKIVGEIKDINVLKDLYRKAMVFLLPHRFDRSPHVIAEAMSAGKPIITSNQGGPIEAVAHGVNGFLIEIGDTNKLSEYLIVLLMDKELRKRLGEEGRRKMVKNYNWDAVAYKIAKVINERLL